MVDTLLAYLTARGSFSPTELARIAAATLVKKVKRRHFLLREDEVCRHMGFVVSGSLRLYRTDERGQEHIVCFAIENGWIGDYESFQSGLPAKGAIAALEDSCLLLWSTESWERLRKEIPAFHAWQSRLVSRCFSTQLDRLYAANSRSAEARYHEFVQSFPELNQRVPLHMIASYLGVTRETLSRSRSRSRQLGAPRE
jgi:CRP-like cAMP-binding protein